MKQVRNLAASGVLLLGFLLPAARTAPAQTPTAVPQLDLNRFMGTWHEIARIPNKPEKHCVSDGLVLYSLADKPRRFQMVTSCKIKDGNPDAWNAAGKTADKTGSGKLKISYLFPFSTKYWVLALGPDYEWALIGSPNHKSLWLLARAPKLAPDLLADIQAKAAAQGYNPTKLALMPQGH